LNGCGNQGEPEGAVGKKVEGGGKGRNEGVDQEKEPLCQATTTTGGTDYAQPRPS